MLPTHTGRILRHHLTVEQISIGIPDLPRVANASLAAALEHMVLAGELLLIARKLRGEAIRHGYSCPDLAPEPGFLDISNPQSGVCRLIRKCLAAADPALTGKEPWLENVRWKEEGEI